MKVKKIIRQQVGEDRPTVNGSGYQMKGPTGLGILALKGLPPGCLRPGVGSREVLAPGGRVEPIIDLIS